MKKFLKHLPKAFIALVAGVVIATSLSATAQASFGPDRPTRVWTNQENGFQYVTFDSYTGVPNGIGDERDFFRGVDVGRDSTWSNPVSNITPGDEVEGKIYIHNNADPLLNTAPGAPGVAHNVTVQVVMPTGITQTQDIKATISASNAVPQSIFDNLEVTGANNSTFGLQYEPGTGQLHEQDGSTTNLSVAQETALTGSGLNLGDQQGCFQHVQEITFKMKSVVPQYTVLKQVRFVGQGAANWVKSINTKANDELQWSIKFSDTGPTQLNQIAIVDNLPAGLDVVPGSVEVFNTNFPKGYAFPDSVIQANGRQINIGIGDYFSLTPAELAQGDVSAQVFFTTKVDAPAATVCSPTTLTNEAFATPQGLGTIEDTASAVVQGNTCTTPPPTTPPTPTPTTPTPATPTAAVTSLVNTGPGDMVGLFSGVTIGGALLHRLFLSRRFAARRGL